MILGTLDSSSREESPVKRALDRLLGLTAFGLLLLSAAMPRTASAEMPDKTAVSRTAEIDGVRFHYLTAGHGAPVILLHGYAETSLMWEADHSPARQALHCHRAGSARHRGLVDSTERSGHENSRDQGACVRPLARNRESQSRRTRHRPDGRLCLRRAVPCGSRETGPDGCVSTRCGWLGG